VIYLSGVGGKIVIKGQGTAQFFIQDDKGKQTSMRIENVFGAAFSMFPSHHLEQDSSMLPLYQ
jgi:hypothetical protein